jgi:hypothetical protein
MKIRNGFVSNSSSSSFIIQLNKMTDKQKAMIYDHIKIGMEIDEKLKQEGKEPFYEYYEQWDVQEDDFVIWCATSMDNFPLYELIISEIKIKREDIIGMGDGNWSRNIFTEEEYIKYKTDYLRRKKIEKINKSL